MGTTKVAIAPMKVAQVPKAGADFQIVEREIPKPGVGHVRIKVEACGVCHSDVLTKRSEEHTSELQSHSDLVCRLLLEKKKGIENYDGRRDACEVRGVGYTRVK